MSRSFTVLLTVLLQATCPYAGPVVAESRSLEASPGRVAFDFRTDDLAADEIRRAIEDRTGLWPRCASRALARAGDELFGPS